MRLIACLAATMLTACASVPGSQPVLEAATILVSPGDEVNQVETITVTQSFSGLVCTGFCVDAVLKVRRDGLVEYRVKLVGRHPWVQRRYRATKAEIERLWRAYAAIRPRGLLGPTGTCDEDTLIIDFDIRWDDDREKPSRLLACGAGGPVWGAYNEGFRALRISSATGKRLPRDMADSLK